MNITKVFHGRLFGLFFGMPMRNLTHDKILELEKNLEDLKEQLKGLQADTEMYKRELDLK